MRINKLLPLLFLVIAQLPLLSQNGIRGKVVDANQAALPGVHVYLDGTKLQAFTDLNGEFKLYGIPAGKYNLIAAYIGYQDLVLPIEPENAAIISLDLTMEDSNLLGEIVINGRLEGQSKALNTRKNKKNITEVIARQQIERFPDANVGDALKRVSGINVQYDQGEARFANIRGTAPELNSITINGERIPSAEAEQRSIQLDLIPADMIETIEVNKAVTPDLDGDAVGGSINLVTQTARKKQHFSGKFGSGYSFLTQKPLYKGNMNYSNRFLDKKVGLMVNASILDKFVRSDNVEAEWETDNSNNIYTSDLQVRQYNLERLRQSYSATLDYQISDNHQLILTGIYNWRNDWENRNRLRFKDIEQQDGAYVAEIRRQTKGGTEDNKFRRLEDQRMQSFSLGGKHFFNKMSVDWNLSSMSASEDRPNERYISVRSKDVPISLDLSDVSVPTFSLLQTADASIPSNYSLRELTEEFQFTEEEDMNARVNVEIPVLFGENQSYIRVGAKVKNKTKIRSNLFSEFEPQDEDGFLNQAFANLEDITNDDFSVGDYKIGQFVGSEFLGNIDLSEGFESEEVLEELAGNFSAEETVTAAYAMYVQNITSKFNFIAGARFEATKVEYSGKIFDGETLTDSGDQSDDYANFMPGIHLNYQLNKWSNVRLAWTNTLARPNYFDLVPYQEIDTEDNNISVGNPALESTTSMNLDLMVEHFFKNIGVVSAGIFYKNLNNIIATRTENDVEFQGNVYEQFEQVVNVGNADLFGLEIGLQRRLDFLPGFLSQLSFYGNYTYNRSELKNITLEDRSDEVLPLVGTPKHLTNLSLSYDTKKLDFRVSYNTAGAFIEEYGDEAFYDRWYDKVDYLDINADYKLTQNWKLYLSVNNILNQPLRYYQGEHDRTMQIEYYGLQTKIGIKFNY